MNKTAFIDIFCRVIDNYGDIGVCWRFAKDLHHILNTFQPYKSHTKFSQKSLIKTLFNPLLHQAQTIRLWVDDLASFAKIEPELKSTLLAQQNQLSLSKVSSNSFKSDTDNPLSNHIITPYRYLIKGIEILHWTSDTIQQFLITDTPAPIVIETFGTDLDENFIQAMRGHTKYWFNLEYLSAEKWVEGFHGQSSPQSNGVPKYFFFPGFSDKTGGLICEDGLIERLNNFSHEDKQQWIAQYIHPSIATMYNHGARFIHVFCYPSAPLESLVEALCEVYRQDQRPTVLLMADGVLPEAEKILGNYLSRYNTIQGNDSTQRYNNGQKPDIRLQRFSFIPQEQFDYLLNIADFNIIRGEDSFVRAIWSGKPFIWHIYEQQEDSHFEKLEAWLSTHNNPLTDLQRAWNHAASWNNPLIKPVSVTEATKAQLHKDLVQYWKALFSSEQKPSIQGYTPSPIQNSSLSWHEIQDFYTNYRESLLKNPTLSFNMLNFPAKQL